MSVFVKIQGQKMSVFGKMQGQKIFLQIKNQTSQQEYKKIIIFVTDKIISFMPIILI